MITKWDKRFLRVAKEVSSWSKDPSSKIGAVICSNRRILSTGYNGFPSSISDNSDRYTNREEKYRYVVHAEMNAIYNATKNGISLQDSTVYVWGLPVCIECAKGIISVGVNNVICAFDPEKTSSKWIESFEDTLDIFEESGIIVKTSTMKYVEGD